MSNIKKLNLSKFLPEASVVIIIVCLLTNPAKYSAVALDGILAWSTLLLPVLLPFFVFSRIFQSLSITQTISSLMKKPMKALFKTPGESAYIFLLSILSGYPVGSKLTADAYENGILSKGEAIRTLSFSSNSGPMFIIGTVGVGMLGNFKLGIIMLASHIIGAILNGLTYRNVLQNAPKPKDKNKTTSDVCELSVIMQNSINSILAVGGYVCLFFVIAEVASSLQLFSPISFLLSKIGVAPNITTSFFNGCLEITKGCLDLSKCTISPKLTTLLCNFVITFGGISTTLQSHFFLKNVISMKRFALMKLSHALYSTAICAIIVSLI